MLQLAGIGLEQRITLVCVYVCLQGMYSSSMDYTHDMLFPYYIIDFFSKGF